MAKKTKLPFSMMPASWGLKGKARARAEAEYYYEGVELEEVLAQLDVDNDVDKEVAKLVNNKVLTFIRESKDNGELYGSIKPKEISTLIKEKINAEVNPSQIILKENLNKVGKFLIDIVFHSEVKAKISIKIDKAQSK